MGTEFVPTNSYSFVEILKSTTFKNREKTFFEWENKLPVTVEVYNTLLRSLVYDPEKIKSYFEIMKNKGKAPPKMVRIKIINKNKKKKIKIIEIHLNIRNRARHSKL